MDTRKKVLQRTVSFITALTFVSASQNQIINVFAQDTASPSQPAAETTQTEAAVTTAASQETTAAETTTTEATTTEATKKVSFKISFTGKYANNYNDKITELLKSVFTNDYADNITNDSQKNTYNLNIPESSALESCFQTDYNTKITQVSFTFDPDGHHATSVTSKLRAELKQEENKTPEIIFTELYNVSSLQSHSRLTFSYNGNAISGEGEYLVPYNGVINITPKNGWKLVNSDKNSFLVSGDTYCPNESTVKTGDNNSYDISTTETTFKLKLDGSSKHIYIPEFGTNIFSFYYTEKSYKWVESAPDPANKDNILVGFSVNAYQGHQVGSVTLTANGTVYTDLKENSTTPPLCPSKYVQFSIPKSYTDNATYTISAGTTPDNINGKIIKQEDVESKTEEIDYSFKINTNKKVELPIFESGDNNTYQYMLTSYQFDENAPIQPDTFNRILQGSTTIEAEYIEGYTNVKATYTKIQSSAPLELYGIISKSYCTQDKTRKNCYIAKDPLKTTIKQTKIFDLFNDFDYSIVYDSLFFNHYTDDSGTEHKDYDCQTYNYAIKKVISDSTTADSTEVTDGATTDITAAADGKTAASEIKNTFIFTHNNIKAEDKNHMPDNSAFVIRGILFDDKQMIDSPIYYYLDDDAPVVKTYNDETRKDNEYWANKGSDFKFKLTIDDKKAFPEDIYGKEVHDALDGISSDITNLQIGGCSFIKNPLTNEWELSETNTTRYTVKVDSELGVTVSLGTDENGNPLTSLNEDINITASDACGNISSDTKDSHITLKIDHSDPVLDSLSVDNLLEDVSGEKTILENGKNLVVHVNASDIMQSDKTSIENGSGIRKVEVDYDSSHKEESKNPDGSGVCTQDYENTFNMDRTQDAKTQICITLTDLAGNRSVYYYDTGSETTAAGQPFSKFPFTFVTTDNSKPVCSLSTKNVHENYTDWYKDYPLSDIIASDNDEKICSMIKTIKIKTPCIPEEQSFNEAYEQTFDVGSASISDYHIIFDSAKDANGNYTSGKVTAYLKRTSDDTDPKVLGSFFIDDEAINGNIDITVRVEDYAGNESIPAHVQYKVDPFLPETVNGVFGYKQDNPIISTKFGTYSNNQVKLTVNLKDSNPTSGLKYAQLTYAGKTYTWNCSKDKANEDTAEFLIPEAVAQQMAVSSDAVIQIFDKAGNHSEKITLKSSKDNENIIIENIPPVISSPKITGENEYTDPLNRKWFSSNVEVEYNVSDSDHPSDPSDPSSGIGNTTFRILENGIETKNFTDNYQELPDKTLSAKYTHNTSEGQSDDGDFTFAVDVSDNAFNPSSSQVTVYKDITAPVITDFKFSNDIADLIESVNGVAMLPFGYFYLQDTDVTVYAQDERASSGIQKIKCILYNTDGSIFSEYTSSPEDLLFENGTYSYHFTVPEGFKGNIQAFATDNVNNSSETKAPDGFILENNDRHYQSSSLDISLEHTDNTDLNNVPLYSSDVTAGISVKDSYSGIRRIEWTTTDYGDNNWKSINIDENGNISGDDASEWTVNETQRNIITDISRNITVSSNLNSDYIRVRLTDNSGNTSEQESVFSIDKTVPVINVSFDNNTPDSKYNNIYKASRSATISINERNFSADRANVAIRNIAGSQVSSNSGWVLVSGTQGTDSAVYQTTVNFFNDGTYSFTVNCSDMCGNQANPYSSEEFIIDKTAPQANVTFDNNSYKNVNFYTKKRTATITITDANFDPDRISIHGLYNSKSEGFPVISGWHSSNGVYTTTIPFDKDGFYTFEVTGSDKAGNPLAQTYNTSFHIDTESPTVKFDGVRDKSANKGDVIPSVLFSDANLDTNSVKITMDGAKRGKNLKLEGKFVQTDDGYQFVADNFEKLKEIDDIYTITASVEDKAGNLTTSTITFSVNRFGSNYIFDESTQQIAGKYINKEQDIIIKEINVDKLKSDPEITITKDGTSMTLTEGTDYQVNASEKDGEWSQYEYVIFAQNFSDDAAYTVAVYSEDKAGNKNNSVDKDKEAELMFGVDKTAPACTILDLDRNGSYRTDSKTVHVDVTDNILINTVDVYLNGSHIDSEFDGSECIFDISSSKSTQSVKLVLADMAGNTTEVVLDNILVSTNAARILLHKTWFKVTCCAVAAAAVGTGAFVLIKKKRERRY